MSRSRISSKYRVLAAVATVSLGIALVAVLSAGAPFPPSPAADPVLTLRQAQYECDKFLQGGAKKKDDSRYKDANDEKGTPHRIYRTKDLWKGKSGDLEKGLWVGAVENKDNTNKKSAFYPELGPGDVGCIFYVRYPTGSKKPGSEYGSVAFLHKKGSDVIRQLQNVIYCSHSTHTDQVEPRVETWPNPNHCNGGDITSTAGGSIKTMGIPGAVATLTANAVEGQAKAAIGNAFTLAFGPWFPCSATGCCRAY